MIDPKAADIAEAFRSVRTATWDAYQSKYGEINQMKANGEWINNWSFYMDGQYVAKRIRAACDMKSNLRMKKLSAIMNELTQSAVEVS